MSLLIGAVISFVVRFLARIPFVKAHPKLCAAILSGAVVVIVAVCTSCGSITAALTQLANQIGALTIATATATAAAVATHEIVIKKALGMGGMNTHLDVPPGTPTIRVVNAGPSALQGGR